MVKKEAAALRRALEAEWVNKDGDLPFNSRASPREISRIIIELDALNALDDTLRNRTAQWLRFASWSNEDTDGMAHAASCLSCLVEAPVHEPHPGEPKS